MQKSKKRLAGLLGKFGARQRTPKSLAITESDRVPERLARRRVECDNQVYSGK